MIHRTASPSGTVWAWGNSVCGEVGDGRSQRARPMQVGSLSWGRTMWPLGVPAVAWQAPSGHVVPYTHDSVSRLRTVTYPDATWSSYTYDPMGNRTELGTQAGTTTYGYDRSDRLLSTAGLSSLSFTYDGRGNETAKGSSTFGYDSANRLTSANTGGTTSTYSYNGEGMRAGKTVGGTTTTYLQDVVGGLPRVLVETTGSQQTLFVYGSGLAWEVRPDGTHRYYHADSLGSARVVTDDAGSPVSAYSYDAYGAVRTSAGEARSFTYTGEETDPESGLEFLRARTYDPATGRFLQRDPVLTVNRYAYAGGNPIRYVDPAGTDWQDALDFLQGVNHGYSDSMSFGLAAQARQAAGVKSPDSDLYYLGRAFGDAGASVSGAGIAGGTPSGDAVLVVGTGGTGAVTIPAAAPIVAYGMTEAANASANAGRDLGTFFARRLGGSKGSESTCSKDPSGSMGGTAAGSRNLPIADSAKAAEVDKTLDLIEAGGPFPYAKNGTVFNNREGLLPPKPSGYYREYTVPTEGAPDRGARRIVQGADGETYYTDDHYGNFVQIDPTRH